MAYHISVLRCRARDLVVVPKKNNRVELLRLGDFGVCKIEHPLASIPLAALLAWRQLSEIRALWPGYAASNAARVPLNVPLF